MIQPTKKSREWSGIILFCWGGLLFMVDTHNVVAGIGVMLCALGVTCFWSKPS